MLLHSQRILLHRRLVAIGYKRRFVTRLRQEPVITEHLKCRTITCILLHILPAHLRALNVQQLLNFMSTMSQRRREGLHTVARVLQSQCPSVGGKCAPKSVP
jgi:hypothetical protein